MEEAAWQPIEPTPLSAVKEKRPNPSVDRSEMRRGDFDWKDMGSGVLANTFKRFERLISTGEGGPPAFDIARRITRSLQAGKILDECNPDDTPEILCCTDGSRTPKTSELT